MRFLKRSVGRLAFSGALALGALGHATGADAQAVPPPAPVVEAPPPVPVAPAPQPMPQGQWVNTAQYGYIWVPAGASVVDVGGVPSVYLYTPTYGWTWYASPWGWGPFAYGAWMHGPWPYGFRVWHHGAYGWGWHAGPQVRVYVAPRPYFYPHPHHHYRHHRRWGGHRFYR